jgi:hypothetical protein
MVQYISRNFRGNFRDPKLFYMYQRLISKLMIELEKSFHTGPACRPLCRLLPPPIGHVGWWSRHAAPRRPPYPRSERSRCLTPDWPPTNRSEAAVDRSPEPPPCPCRSRRHRSAELWGALTSIASPCLRTTRASLPCTRAGTSSAASSPPQFRALSPPHGSSSISKLPAATSSASPGSPRESRRSARTGQPELPSHCRSTMEAGAVPSSELLCCPRRALVLHECRPSRC